MRLPDSSILTNFHFPGNAKAGNLLFEKKYIGIRAIENRLYTDEEVEQLPNIASDHTHCEEWATRKRSSRRLIANLSARKKRLNILEVGCGNGWLSHQLAVIPGAEVVGLDINFTELQQAARVFNGDAHLRFVYGDMGSGILHDSMFDIIVFAASIQYFRSFRKIMNVCLQQLKPGGEIHVMDSHFYRLPDLMAAKKRTLDYYTSLGYPEMNDYYFHHSINELHAFNHTILYNPYSVLNRFANGKTPFHWICIKND